MNADPPALLPLLEGLVPLHIAKLSQPGAQDRAIARVGDLADMIAEAGDRLTAPGNFRALADRHTRGRLLNAMAEALALGALQPGGVTWNGHHWCTSEHAGCLRWRRPATTVPTRGLL